MGSAHRAILHQSLGGLPASTHCWLLLICGPPPWGVLVLQGYHPAFHGKVKTSLLKDWDQVAIFISNMIEVNGLLRYWSSNLEVCLVVWESSVQRPYLGIVMFWCIEACTLRNNPLIGRGVLLRVQLALERSRL